MIGCNDSQDLIVPKPDPSPLEVENERLRAEIEDLRDELGCYRSLAPGWMWSKRHNMLVDIDGPMVTD